jgi:hypothetical protein
MTHTAAILAKDKVPGAAILAFTAGDSRCSQHRHPLSTSHSGNVSAHLDHCAGELMAENHGGKIAVGVVHDVDIGSANAAKRNLHLDLVVSAWRLHHIQNVEVAISGSMLYECFHGK